MRDSHWRDHVQHHARVESYEPRLLMTGQAAADVRLDAVIDPQHDGTVDASVLGTAVALGGVSNSTTTVGLGINDLVGLTAERALYGLTGAGQTVAVIDSGIAYDHPALGGGFGPQYRVVGGWDFAENDANPYDFGPGGGHGTHVSGIIASTDKTSPGVAPGVDLVDLRVFNNQGQSSFDWLDKALEWVHDHRNSFEFPITTVNISIGSMWNSTTVPKWSTLEGDLAQLKNDGIFIAVAAGNSFATYNTPGLSYPAASPSVVPVMSVDNNGSLSSFSQRQDLAIAAPGRAIRSTVPDYVGNLNGKTDDFATYSGTSMAAPFVAGASVLVREAMQMVGMTGITEDTIYNVMRNTADVVYDPLTAANYLRINVGRALGAILPADDYGSTADTAYNLGTTGSTTIAGLIGRLDDHDCFTFTAAQTGTAKLNVTATGELRPVWQRLGGAGQTQDGGNTLSFDVIAGKTYTVDLSTGQGLGKYSIKLNINSAITDLGVVDLKQLDHRDFSGGETWYRFTASRSGIVTAQVFAASGTAGADLALFNSAQQPIAANGNSASGRVDVNANAGDVFYVRVRGGPRDASLRVTNLVSQTGTTVDVAGTAGDDSFQFQAGATVMITIDGVSYQFAAASAKVVQFDGGAGNDSAALTGATGNDNLVMRPDSAQMSGAGYQVSVVNAENIVANGGAGSDRAVFYDSAGDDTFVASPLVVSMTGANYSNLARGFRHVEAVSTHGHDVAYFSDSAGNDVFTASPTLAAMYGTNYYLQATNFAHVEATASQGQDQAYFYDSAGDDTFVAAPLSASMTGANYSNLAKGFGHVHAIATQGHDVAFLSGSSGNDIFSASPTLATMVGDGYYFQASGFDRVEAKAGPGGFDQAFLYDSSGNDTLVAAGSLAALYGTDFYNLAQDFGWVWARGTTGINSQQRRATDYVLSATGAWQ